MPLEGLRHHQVVIRGKDAEMLSCEGAGPRLDGAHSFGANHKQLVSSARNGNIWRQMAVLTDVYPHRWTCPLSE